MKQIKPLEPCDLRTTSLLKREKSLKQNCYRLELNWRELQNSTSERTDLKYDFSSPNIASSSVTVFVSPANNVNYENNECKTDIASENVDKGKSILGAPSKLEKRETKNPMTKKVNNKKSQSKKPHLCHHCET